jgi:hypothetical protein
LPLFEDAIWIIYDVEALSDDPYAMKRNFLSQIGQKINCVVDDTAALSNASASARRHDA